MPFLNIREPRTRENSSINLKSNARRMRRNVRSRDFVSCKRKLLIVKLKSMPSEPREHSKKVRDKLVSVKSSRLRRDKESLLTSNKLVRDNSRRSR